MDHKETYVISNEIVTAEFRQFKGLFEGKILLTDGRSKFCGSWPTVGEADDACRFFAKEMLLVVSSGASTIPELGAILGKGGKPIITIDGESHLWAVVVIAKANYIDTGLRFQTKELAEKAINAVGEKK